MNSSGPSRPSGKTSAGTQAPEDSGIEADPAATTPAQGLRERKRARTRVQIVQSALELFAERGYDAVTVSEIAERAEIGRTTFFRYFPDKHSVFFADDDARQFLIRSAIATAAEPHVPLGDDLAASVRAMRPSMIALAETVAGQASINPLRHRLIGSDMRLAGAQRRVYTDIAIDELMRHGAERDTAALASHLAAACYSQAYMETVEDAAQLPSVTARYFDRLAELGALAQHEES